MYQSLLITQRLKLGEKENLTRQGIHATGRALIAHPVGGDVLRQPGELPFTSWGVHLCEKQVR